MTNKNVTPLIWHNLPKKRFEKKSFLDVTCLGAWKRSCAVVVT